MVWTRADEGVGVDRIMGHVLWNLSLSANDIKSGPGVTANWHWPAELEGHYQVSTFLSSETDATDRRDQHQFLQWIQHDLKHAILLHFSRGTTWRERWHEWNRLFPDWTFPNEQAMRKNVEYWRKSSLAKTNLSDSIPNDHDGMAAEVT